MSSALSKDCHIEKAPFGYIGTFKCMASVCEVLVESHSKELVTRITNAVATEAYRIEGKFSRYNALSVIGLINSSPGSATEVDNETANLLDYASVIFDLSEGAFDITTGILGKLWKFDCSDHIPAAQSVNELMKCVGWNKVIWQKPLITLSKGMAIDFGGIGKEYAVDTAFDITAGLTNCSFLINFGGDIRASAPPESLGRWTIGIDAEASRNREAIALKSGGLATSGDKNRYLLKDGQRYSHILDARTGWPVVGAPASVTVAAPSCVEAGMLATMASLRGSGAKAFLEEQGVPFWISDSLADAST